ncbi:hypothetical protein [Bacillus mojavensis]|uniref:hypothetical protein n=1 Tax=Bacillus mojavensis TaxID=72360 RepID=UPI002DBF0646|nr:hypothetical protein [Bacillus mojavensis]MEC1756016.1 hypothetical protein [Bacillus mojavensis]
MVDMNEFEKAMRYVRATLGFEGLVLKEEEEKLLGRRFHGEITEEEYIRKALELSYSGD